MEFKDGTKEEKTAFVRWTKDLAVGIPFVDADHKVLVSLLNQARDCIDQREENITLGSVLRALVEFTEYHFGREEKLMDLCGYTGLDAHKTTHNDLVRQLDRIRQCFDTNPEALGAAEVSEFLRKWLIEHIKIHDFAYRSACAASEAAAVTIVNAGGAGRASPEWDTLRILAIEDNPNFRRLIGTILKAAGVRDIRLAETAAEGFAQLCRRPAEVVLCDWMMDEMNGTEFARRLHEMALPTKVIMLTGLSVDVLRERAPATAVDDFLEKPITIRRLLESISKVVSKPTECTGPNG